MAEALLLGLLGAALEQESNTPEKTADSDDDDWEGDLHTGRAAMVIGTSRGPAGISIGDIGTIKGRDGDGDFKVNFPKKDGWFGQQSDLRYEPVASAIRGGQRVRVRSGIEPSKGWGFVSRGDVGLVVKHKGDNQVVVDFGYGDMWKGLASELEPVGDGSGHWKTSGGIIQCGRAVKLRPGAPAPDPKVDANAIGFATKFHGDSFTVDFPKKDGAVVRATDLELDAVADLIRPSVVVYVKNPLRVSGEDPPVGTPAKVMKVRYDGIVFVKMFHDGSKRLADLSAFEVAKCRNGHTLYSRHSMRHDQYICNLCRIHVGKTCIRCDRCDFDLCKQHAYDCARNASLLSKPDGSLTHPSKGGGSSSSSSGGAEGLSELLGGLLNSAKQAGKTPWEEDEAQTWSGPFQPGQAVKIIGKSMAKQGSSIQIGDVGIVKKQHQPGVYVINLPKANGFIAAATDLEFEEVADIVRKGARVKVREYVTEPKHKWGNVRHGDVGLVVQDMRDGVVGVDFGHDNVWRGLISELETVTDGSGQWPARVQCGQAVKVKPGVDPRYGWGKVNAQSVGYVDKLQSDAVVVNFPEQDGVKIHYSEVVVDTRADAIRPKSYVRVKSSIQEPHFKWGGVNHSMVGMVRYINHDAICFVEFPVSSAWKCKLCELEDAPPPRTPVTPSFVTPLSAGPQRSLVDIAEEINDSLGLGLNVRSMGLKPFVVEASTILNGTPPTEPFCLMESVHSLASSLGIATNQQGGTPTSPTKKPVTSPKSTCPVTTETETYDIVLSVSSGSVQAAADLRKQLRSSGFTVWERQPHHPLESEPEYFDVWQQAASKCKKIVCLLSAQYAKSTARQEEWKYAASGGKLCTVLVEPLQAILDVNSMDYPSATEVSEYLSGGAPCVKFGACHGSEQDDVVQHLTMALANISVRVQA